MKDEDLKRALDNIYGPDDLVRAWDSEPVIMMDLAGPFNMDLSPGAINYVGEPPKLVRKPRRQWWQEIAYRWRLMIMSLKGEIDHED